MFWIWWLAILSALAILTHAIGLGFVHGKGEIMPAQVIEATERAWIEGARQGPLTDRRDEVTSKNRGYAARISEA